MRSLLVIHSHADPASEQADTIPSWQAEPEHLLESNGYLPLPCRHESEIKQLIHNADAAVLNIPVGTISMWSSRLEQTKAIPLLWWCSATSALSSTEACEADVTVDGILTPSMAAHELNWALHFSAKCFFERQHWQSERKQLTARLEERKWIDMAKGILGEVNGIPEAEAYDLLRKKAMNERKRIVDVAISIVKAQQMLKA
ncbi:ANTAR domain-containing response regulator [Paenibacillus polymyxa]|uniref:ANTAR domain-containing response regulator n=1 Tax=Paenibacillus TaxID=44249 RepID=UPI000F4EE74B|nr:MULTISPECIES: ANTAR domain-containing protein [Paenibacillus]KAF6659065.1 ANTAR domain-containing protein [Paenibacillus sp. EKM301P]RPE02746.1 ANTAR domain-containing protein [Paenibacillus polymyxa]UBS85603.1 ANTAR domain-containing protein [Paenibacillus polymyxa]WHX34120.1 ANTAR domain-containing protein [Paenibacillus polymyxa]